MVNQTNHDYVGPGNTFDWQIVFFTSKLEEKKIARSRSLATSTRI